jgi:hypothetical protein
LDVVSFGDRPRRRPSRRVVTSILLAVVAIVSASVLVGHDGQEAAPPAPSGSTRPPSTPGPPCAASIADRPTGPAALVLGSADPAGHTLQSCDGTAAVDGPWTVVVRAVGGSLGQRGAVVTFPAEGPGFGRRVDIGGAAGTVGGGVVTWPVAGKHARVRGDLIEPTLLAIAAGTTVVAGRPVVTPPSGLMVVFSGTYRPTIVRQIRYGTAELGEQAELGSGLTYTGVVDGGGFEDWLYAVPTRDGGLVRGRHAIVSAVLGGNATLAWEAAPGVVAFIGYSGAELDDGAVAALRRLAARSRLLTEAEWTASTPQTVNQRNDIGTV